jgi:hypothetical protein
MTKIQEKIKAKKILKDFGIFLIILIIVSVILGGVVVNGFFFHVPSTATYLQNYENLGSLTWDAFVSNHTQLDSKHIVSTTPADVWITVSRTQSITVPHNYISFEVSYGTKFEVDQTYGNPYSKATLVQPSLLILLLDQNDRIRGKLYTTQSSPDFTMNGNNETDNLFWFKIPSDMQNQPITLIVELWGVENLASSVGSGYNNDFYGQYTHALYIDTGDSVYGTIPSEPSQYLGQGYVNQQFLATGTLSTATPPLSPSFWDVVGYSTFFAFLLSVLSSTFVLIKDKTVAWWSKNKIYVVFGVMFLITYVIILVIVGALFL